MIRTLPVRFALVIASGALAVACTTTSGAAAPSTVTTLPTAPTVQEQIEATSKGLDAALAAYRAGDAVKAEELAGDAYLEHFEFVEGPLESVDEELTEELEDLIRDELRAAIKAGKPVAEIEALITEAKTDLATAAVKLD